VDLIFYDGHCGLCHWTVRFVLSQDKNGALFRFAPLQSNFFNSTFTAEEQKQFVETLVLRTAAGASSSKFSAIRMILRRLGGIWTLFGIAMLIVPNFLGDLAYDAIARIRHLLFARPKALCPVIPKHLRDRFEDDE
jgi:predicted DCC family thiol-disulfide oxidoreductase YuxK